MTQTHTFDFDTPIDRRGTASSKWGNYPEDVLPMWVADMDFRAPPAVLDALQHELDFGIFGYTRPLPSLTQAVVDRMRYLYEWDIAPESIVYLHGIMIGVNVAAQAFAKDGGVLVQPPVYYPFHETPSLVNASKQEAPLTYVPTLDGRFTYEIDFDAFERAITPETDMFLFCSPHNPVGRVWTCDEVAQIAEICVRNDLIICSDEVHSDLLLGGTKHIPTVVAYPEARDRTITLIAASKTFNLPGLNTAIAIIENADLRHRFLQAGRGTVFTGGPGDEHGYVNTFGYVALEAAYRDGGPWLEALKGYLTENRNDVQAYIREHMPAIKPAVLEGTYLQWLDCRELDLPGVAADWFLENAKVAFNKGEMFGEGGEGFVRMNLGTSRARMHQALGQMRAALAAR